MPAIILTAAILAAQPPPQDWTMCTTSGQRIVRHDAFPSVLARYPERAVPGAYYAATNDCNDLNQWRVLVVGGQAYFVLIADCAAAEDVAYRESMGYVADVGKRLWERIGLPFCPVAGQLLTLDQYFGRDLQ
jgi:hypothetical protein